jgi:phosphonatase-like hydrolase
VSERLGLEREQLLEDLLLLQPDGMLVRGAEAYRHALRRIWWAWPVWLLSVLPLARWVFDRGYRTFADHRHRISRTCGLSPQGETASGAARVQLFLFDIAGTVMRDDDLVVEALRRTGREAGLEVDEAWLRTQMGLSKTEVFEAMLARAGRPTAPAPDLARRFGALLEQVLDEHPPQPQPGAVEALAALEAAGVRVGFTTGFTRALPHRILTELGWGDRLLIASDEVERGRPAPDMIHEAMRRAGVADVSRVGVCGDTPADLRTGHAAGCALVVGVCNGTHRRDQLEPHPHTHLLADLHALAPIVAR